MLVSAEILSYDHCFKYRLMYRYIGRDTNILSKTIW